MSTPQDPAEPHDHDAAWRSIVDNYGERPELEEPGDPVVEPPVRIPPSLRDLDGPRPEEEGADTEGHFVPPPPPPVPRTSPPRLIAWLGLFLVPTLVLVAIVARVAVPTLVGLVLMVWFVGGFVYLVASMRPGPRDDYDDGAVL